MGGAFACEESNESKIMSEEYPPFDPDKETTAILLSESCFGSALLNVKFEPDKSLKTYAITDGKVIKYNPELMAKESPAARRYILAHTIMHPMLLHNWRFGKEENHKLAERACDEIINHILQKRIEELSRGGRCSIFEEPKQIPVETQQRFATMCEEEVIAVLRKEMRDGGDGKAPRKKGKGKGNDQGQQPGDGGGEEKPEPQEGIGDFSEADQSEPEENATKEFWIRHLQSAKQMGHLPAGMERYVENSVAPKVPWQELLRHKITARNKDNLNWMKPHQAYLQQRIYLPSLYSERMGEVVVVRDTSGSIGERELSFATAEALAILETCQPEKLVLADCDAEIGRWDEYEPGDDIKAGATGGGGTSFKPPFARITEEQRNPEVLIYVTDGYGDFPKEAPAYDVIWLMTTDVKPPFGECIKVDL